MVEVAMGEREVMAWVADVSLCDTGLLQGYSRLCSALDFDRPAGFLRMLAESRLLECVKFSSTVLHEKWVEIAGIAADGLSFVMQMGQAMGTAMAAAAPGTRPDYYMGGAGFSMVIQV